VQKGTPWLVERLIFPLFSGGKRERSTLCAMIIIIIIILMMDMAVSVELGDPNNENITSLTDNSTWLTQEMMAVLRGHVRPAEEEIVP